MHTMENMLDSWLVVEARKGKPEAFARLVRRHSDLVYRVALRVLGDEEEARDASQEAWIRAWRGLDRFKGESAFTTWLYRITVNACLNHRRDKRPVEHVELCEETLHLPDLSGDPQAEISNREMVAQVELCLREIRAEHRAALVLRHVEGLGYPEIADILEVPQAKVRAWVSRGRAEMVLKLTRERVVQSAEL